MQHIAIDIMRLLPCNEPVSYIFVVIDVLYRFVYLQAVPKKSAEVRKAFMNFVGLFGLPRIIQSDNG